MGRTRLGEGEHYHIYNRGVEKRLIFSDDKDRWRFLTLLIAFQGNVVFNQMSRLVRLDEHRRFDIKFFKETLKQKNVELVCFCLIPNHFHFILKEIQEGGISKFMQRLADAYTKYFNLRHGRTGHLFGGRFQSVRIDRNEYLNYLSAYIHLNPKKLVRWKGREVGYPWSSFQDFVGENRWGKFLNNSIILEQFKNGKEYGDFVEDAPIKEKLEDDYLLDNVEH